MSQPGAAGVEKEIRMRKPGLQRAATTSFLRRSWQLALTHVPSLSLEAPALFAYGRKLVEIASPPLRVLVGAVALCSCSACGHYPKPISAPGLRPPVAISEAELEAFTSQLASGAPILETIYASLQANDPNGDGSAYAFTPDNALPSGWLVQTPNAWGRLSNDVPIGAGSFVADDIEQLVSSAEQFVDITSLYPWPSGAFFDSLVGGLQNIARSGRPVQVRILVGLAPDPLKPATITPLDYLRMLVEGIGSGFPRAQLDLYVAYQRSSLFSWNHAKMVAVDGQRVLLGGENLWDPEYLEVAPVHDLNVRVDGPIVYFMHRFTDTTWGNVCAQSFSSWQPVHWSSRSSPIDHQCLGQSPVRQPPGQGQIAVLGAGRYGSLGPNPADAALLLAMTASRDTIRISQQDLLNVDFDPWSVGFKTLARALVAGRDVYIVLTNDNAKAGPSGNPYSTSTVRKTADVIELFTAAELGVSGRHRLTEILCTQLHLTTLRFGPSDTWSNGFEFANHAKFMMIDEALFFVGSENLYPADLIEYGVFVSDPDAVQQMRAEYWDQLWSYSSRVAISGAGVPNCYFRE